MALRQIEARLSGVNVRGACRTAIASRQLDSTGGAKVQLGGVAFNTFFDQTANCIGTGPDFEPGAPIVERVDFALRDHQLDSHVTFLHFGAMQQEG